MCDHVISMCPHHAVTDLEMNIVKSVLYISTLHDFDHGIPEAAILLHLMGKLRAHPDGSYTTGPMLQWERCYLILADVHFSVTKVLKHASTHLLEYTCSPSCHNGLLQLAAAVPTLGSLRFVPTSTLRPRQEKTTHSLQSNCVFAWANPTKVSSSSIFCGFKLPVERHQRSWLSPMEQHA